MVEDSTQQAGKGGGEAGGEPVADVGGGGGDGVVMDGMWRIAYGKWRWGMARNCHGEGGRWIWIGCHKKNMY